MRSVSGGKSGPARSTSVGREIEQRGTVQRNARNHLRLIDVLALPGDVAMIETGQGAHRAIHAAGIVHV